MEQELIAQKVESGYIHAKIILEMAGQPKEHIERTLKEYVEKIKESHIIEVIKEDFAECQEQGDLWSTFVELELLIKGISNFIGFCFDFMPSSIEVIAPFSMTFNCGTVSNFLNDLQAKLHSLDMVTKQKTAENNFLKRNFQSVVRNLFSIIIYKKELTSQEISKISGIPQNETEEFLKTMVDENKIKKSEDKYTLNIPGEVNDDGAQSS